MDKRHLLSAINSIIPKFNIVIFNSSSDFSDNAYSIYEYIVNNRPDITKKYSLIWAVNNKENLHSSKSHGHKIVYKKSLLGLFCFLISKYVICTHNYYYDVRSGNQQIIYNLWHGCGYKKLKNDKDYYRGDYTFVTSDVYIKIQSVELNIPQKNVIATGLARNDQLFTLYGSLKTLGIDKNKYSNVLIWLPTFRKSKSSLLGDDGDTQLFGMHTVIKGECENLYKILANTNTLLIIKPHPLERIDNHNLLKTDNICIITDEMLESKNLNLYNILQETDVLLSDYSSVIVDYLLLDKPIGLICSDFESYKNDRGFVFEKIEEYMPGPLLNSEEDLINYIQNKEWGSDVWKSKMIAIKRKLHRYSDNNSCCRIVDYIFGEKGCKDNNEI